MAAAIALAFATLVSEDLACVTAGLLVARGDIDLAAALAGCGVGIWVGDCGLWAVGRLARLAAFRWRWLERRRWPPLQNMAHWIDRKAGATILVSRFVPGLRLPAYLVAGAAGVSFVRFGVYSGVAALLWTPLLVYGSMQLGMLGDAWLSPVTRWGAPLGAAAVIGLLAAARSLVTVDTLRRVDAKVSRWRRWEFWPMWLFYPPVAAWIAWLTVRHGGLSTMTAANPGMADGGTVGESKSAILAALPSAWTVPHVLIRTGRLEARVRHTLDALAREGWPFPVVLKPDVGQRGAGVKLVASPEGVHDYLSRTAEPVILQPYHPGPFEAGVFYYRFPGWRSGRILSITDKEFPAVVGDGRSTLLDLIWAHPRYRMQASLFVARHRTRVDRLVPAGEVVQLAMAGNHAQGTVFRDGSHLITAALEQRIDEIAQSYPGFFVGRFDVRYADVEAFRAGRDFAIVELNGATAESTNIYDPDASLAAAYRTLFRQWSIVFAIGAANRRLGVAGTSMLRLARLVATHVSARPAFEFSD